MDFIIRIWEGPRVRVLAAAAANQAEAVAQQEPGLLQAQRDPRLLQSHHARLPAYRSLTDSARDPMFLLFLPFALQVQL